MKIIFMEPMYTSLHMFCLHTHKAMIGEGESIFDWKSAYRK